MNYLERDQNGEYDQIWKELQDLGASIREEPSYLLFVSYLRLAILRWGGFPGLEGRGIPFEYLDHLVAELELF
jgi:hypothetical protein